MNLIELNQSKYALGFWNITNYLHFAENPIQFGSVVTKK